jgi:fido (protein-threonine AMPylation protein)
MITSVIIHNKTGNTKDCQYLTSADDADIINMAAAYTAGIVGNHPFVDGNNGQGLSSESFFLSSMAIGSRPAKKMRRKLCFH